MLKYLILLWLPVLANAQYDSILFDGQFRTYLLHPPSDPEEETEDLPLVIAMHGGFGNAYNLESQSQLSLKADESKFIVVYPEGRESALNIRTWNAGWCCGYASTAGVNDVGFINALLDTLLSKYPIDAGRVYATGMSNGGFMSYRLACELSDRIAAIAPVAASMSMTGCSPERPVPVIHFHSYRDESVPPSGGVGTGPSGHHNPPVDSVLNGWTSLNSCSIPEDTVESSLQYTRVQWENCACGGKIEVYLTEDGGHSWPGGRRTLVGDPVSEYISATERMWDFFQQHSLTCKDEQPLHIGHDQDIRVFPNPASGILSVSVPDVAEGISITVFNTAGQIILQTTDPILNLSGHAPGFYFLSVRSDGNEWTKKILLK